ncbi:hypothetical protein [Rubellimicrobium sp. CFH 75288]|uniref:hypothetical protein n=1 Tax=Rubellimicrobium sp. CFH 75288 TaxID=2697034 RepID=UPI0014129ECC|nr:hypothetical protein [Rubellimicrobium sp. CFH 75288]NAZ37735.1 hypothetical protein [Rubellimicrobium sp. CFH 75288]
MMHLLDSLWTDEMAFVAPLYSKRQIERAGRVLGERIPADGLTPEVIEAFNIAHNHRESCALPMVSVRHELRHKVQRDGGSGIAVGRLKRMSSIRRKLFAKNRTLYQIQDIAGVRAILPAMADVHRVAGYFHDGETRHGIVRTDDYIQRPKRDGYRSLHIVLKFNGERRLEKWSKSFVEVQLRTNLQHAWATAVEAVGLMRGENLKAGLGDPDWLRFFALMSGEIAHREGEPISATLDQNRSTRLVELRDLEARLHAIDHLDGYAGAIKYINEEAMAGRGYFLISFDRETKTVIVRPYSIFSEGAQAYNSGEGLGAKQNVVLVEADRARDLTEAYPNYFLDVRKFLSECRMAISENPNNPPDTGDYSWLHNWRRRARSGR